jgi:hypothetical protein
MVRRAFGAQSRKAHGRQREPQILVFARPSCASDLPVKKSRALEAA